MKPARPETSQRITLADFTLATSALSLFTPDEETSAAKLLRGLLPKWERHFDAEPLVLPSAPGMPREVPKIVLRSLEGSWRCEIASGRMNLVWESRQPRQRVLFDEIVRTALPLFTEYQEFLRCRVGRLSAVITRFVVAPSPGLFLAKHFCQEPWLTAPLNRPESFELHAHKRYAFPAGFDVNSWVRNKTALLTEGSEPIVLVEQDLNTLPEEAAAREFSPTDIKNFFTTANTEFDSILSLYYP